MNVIVVNPHAKRLRENDRIKRKIHEKFADRAHIIDADERHDVIFKLNELNVRGATIETIFIVGGDGTFSHILNWVTQFPIDAQPAIISVGGGQFCYMTRFHGLPSRDPVKNLTRIFEGKLRLRQEQWEPLCVTDSLTHERRYAAVVANGVVCDIVQWYEDVGKGGIFTVLRIILMAILSVMSNWIRRMVGRIHLLEGRLNLGSFRIKPKAYAGMALSMIPELLASCRPFKGRRNPYQFYAIAYWGGLRRLAIAAPFIWFGHAPFWTRRATFNDTVRDAQVETTDPRLLLDGDLFVWPGSTRQSRQPRVLTITAGHQIPIRVVAS